MRLYFLRHGKAEAREAWTMDDAARPLSLEGRAETERAARGLATLKLGITRALTSPYARARETAELAGAALGLPVEESNELAAGCELKQLASALAGIAPEASVLLVGHEPDFSTLIGQLIGGRERANLALKKGACCRVDLSTDAASAARQDARKLLNGGTLRWLMTAKQLAMLSPAIEEAPVRAPAHEPSTGHTPPRRRNVAETKGDAAPVVPS